jgi:hypothetical protein
VWIIESKAGDFYRTFDLRSLPALADGRQPFQLSRDELYRVLKKLGVKVDPRDGHQSLLIAYSRHLAPPTPDAPTASGGITSSKTLGAR